MQVAIGADHGGFRLKQRLVAWLERSGHVPTDCGAHSTAACDYPRIGATVARTVACGAAQRGVLLCKSGIGIAIAANKVRGIRAAHCRDTRDARLSRQHNDANVLVLGASQLSTARAQRMLSTWLKTPFESGGRHARRVRQLTHIERQQQRGRT